MYHIDITNASLLYVYVAALIIEICYDNTSYKNHSQGAVPALLFHLTFYNLSFTVSHMTIPKQR